MGISQLIPKLPFNRAQTELFYNRRRRKSLFDPAFELFQTHTLRASQNPLSTAAFFPNVLARPATFAIDLVRTGASPIGTIFEFGDDARGIAVSINGATITFAAGANAASDSGVDVTTTDVVAAQDQTYRFVFSVHPNRGGINFWVNGQIAGAGQSVNTNFGGGWAAAEDGAIDGIEGTVTDRIPMAERVALTDVILVTPLRVFARQLPRQFRNFTIGTTGGGGSWSNGFDSGFGG